MTKKVYFKDFDLEVTALSHNTLQFNIRNHTEKATYKVKLPANFGWIDIVLAVKSIVKNALDEVEDAYKKLFELGFNYDEVEDLYAFLVDFEYALNRQVTLITKEIFIRVTDDTCILTEL